MDNELFAILKVTTIEEALERTKALLLEVERLTGVLSNLRVVSVLVSKDLLIGMQLPPTAGKAEEFEEIRDALLIGATNLSGVIKQSKAQK